LQTVLLGISGSISAYKIPELIRKLKKRKGRVIPIMTRAAHQFVTPLSLETVAEEKVWTDQDLMAADSPHITLSRQADIMITAPCSANLLAKYTNGIADSLLTNCFLAFNKQHVIAPAMHTEMWQHPATQRNIAHLTSQGITVVGPGHGDLACGDTGDGRLIHLNHIVDAVQLNQFPAFSLVGTSILITAGGTREAIDPVRVITNRSTGQLGHLLAVYAALAGATVRLITTHPFDMDLPNIKVIPVETAEEMSVAVHSHVKACNRLYMAAAVSDFTIQKSDVKLRRSDPLPHLTPLPTIDILESILSIKTEKQKIIGFCLGDKATLKQTALEKCQKKKLDAILANTNEAFGQPHRDVYFFIKGKKEPLWSGRRSISEICYKLLTVID
jgi:phosphopantothenoylcysteine decarboxylase/phosphopantothenate--cysteine ligase